MVEAPPSFNAKAFREALGLFATGVTVVTTTTATGDRLGTTASSFNSVSLNPPLVLFSLARNAKSFDAWLQAKSYAVNILSEEQDHISNRFARALTDKWSKVECESGPTTNQPLFPDALASFECVTYANYDGGDHLIMVGCVVSTQRRQSQGRPLIFYGSRYRTLENEINTIFRNADIWMHGW